MLHRFSQTGMLTKTYLRYTCCTLHTEPHVQPMLPCGTTAATRLSASLRQNCCERTLRPGHFGTSFDTSPRPSTSRVLSIPAGLGQANQPQILHRPVPHIVFSIPRICQAIVNWDTGLGTLKMLILGLAPPKPQLPLRSCSNCQLWALLGVAGRMPGSHTRFASRSRNPSTITRSADSRAEHLALISRPS